MLNIHPEIPPEFHFAPKVDGLLKSCQNVSCTHHVFLLKFTTCLTLVNKVSIFFKKVDIVQYVLTTLPPRRSKRRNQHCIFFPLNTSLFTSTTTPNIHPTRIQFFFLLCDSEYWMSWRLRPMLTLSTVNEEMSKGQKRKQRANYNMRDFRGSYSR